MLTVGASHSKHVHFAVQLTQVLVETAKNKTKHTYYANVVVKLTTLTPNYLASSAQPVPVRVSSLTDCVFQVSSLSILTGLQQLSLAENPCVQMTANKEYPLVNIERVHLVDMNKN